MSLIESCKQPSQQSLCLRQTRLLHSERALVGGPETVVGQHLTLQRPWMGTALWKKMKLLLWQCMKSSVITGMRARMTEQIFALNALSGQGNCY